MVVGPDGSGASRRRLVSALPGWSDERHASEPHQVGVLPGEGVGPEVIRAAVGVLGAVEDVSSHDFEVRVGGAIGLTALHESGTVLTAGVVSFCDSVFDAGGAVLCGPGGGRFVYELRQKFDLFCKLTPVRPLGTVSDASVVRPEISDGVDLLFVRENVGGLYFGEYGERSDGGRLIEAHHSARYDVDQVERILRVACRLAQARCGRLHVVVKPGGLPTISALWIEQSELLAREFGVAFEHIEVDNACYQVVADARRFDVVVSPNMFGDVIADAASLLLGSRGLSFSVNFSGAGQAVYQTAHGAAYDLAGKDRANPVGQIQSLALLLRESFGLLEESERVMEAVEWVLGQGWRTQDLAGPESRVVGTRELSDRIEDRIRSGAERPADSS